MGEIARATAEQTRNSAHVADAAQRTSAMVQQISGALGEQRRAGNALRASSESALGLCEVVRRASSEELQASRFVQERIASISELLGRLATSEDASGVRDALTEAVNDAIEASRKSPETDAGLEEHLAALRVAVERLGSLA